MQQTPQSQTNSAPIIQIGANLLALLRIRTALFAIELGEEVEHAKRLLIVILSALIFAAIGLIFAGLCVVALMWDTHRLAALFFVTTFYLVVGGLLIAYAKKLADLQNDAFIETRRELRKDLNMFSDQHEQQ